MVLLVVITCAPALAGNYRDQLIEQYPFYKTATTSFAPVYPALAQQVVGDYGITKGICVDMGGGCGSLAMALARITDLTVYMLDIDPAAVRLCGLLVDEAGLRGRVRPIEGDAQDMPFRDSFADLVVSRGSIFFWPDQLAGLKEAYRILKPGGVAYVGGGFSRILDPKVRDPLVQERKNSLAQGQGEGGGWRLLDEDLVERAKAAGMDRIRLLREPEVGWWIELRK